MKALSTFALITAAVVPSAARFAAADFDFAPYVTTTNGVSKIGVGGHDDQFGTDVAVLHVSQFDFGENAQDPYNTGDPGFNTDGGAAFKAGSSLTLTGQKTAGSSLLYWDGNGSPNFKAAPAGVSLVLADSPATTSTVTASSQTYSAGATSLFIDTFANNGSLHRHLQSSLFFDGLQTAGSVPAGDYLVAFTLANPGGNNVAASDTEYALFNSGLSDDQADAAVDYVNATYVPEPATLGMAAVAGVGLLRRRRA